MTRKQRNQTGRNITYDLSNPRNIAAFEALLQDEEAEEAAATSTSSSRPSKATRQQQARKKREKEKFFLLKDDAGTTTTPPASQEEQVQLLLEMFEGAADRSLVSDVYQASGCSVEAAAEALFGLLGGGDDNAAGAPHRVCRSLFLINPPCSGQDNCFMGHMHTSSFAGTWQVSQEASGNIVYCGSIVHRIVQAAALLASVTTQRGVPLGRMTPTHVVPPSRVGPPTFRFPRGQSPFSD